MALCRTWNGTIIFYLILTTVLFIVVMNLCQLNTSNKQTSNLVLLNDNLNSDCMFCDKSIAIIGLVHNSASTIQHLLNELDILSCFFLNTVYLFYESNSNDDTLTILQKWQKQDSKSCNNSLLINQKITKMILDVLPLDINQDNISLDRTERYAKYRNYLLDELKAFSKKSDYSLDYVLMIDCDIISFDPIITLNQLYHAINGLGYSVMCNHGIFGDQGWYYDVFATILDNGNWTRFDYFYQRKKLDDIINANNFTNVMSCFNGIAIYKFNALKQTQCKYIESEMELSMKYPYFIDKYLTKFRQIKKDDNAMICEHIGFNYCLLQNGYKIAISRDAFVYYNKESLGYSPQYL